jgi:pyrroline-5-carboxylate reductase
VRPQVVGDVVRTLRFRSTQKVVSVIATLDMERLSRLVVPATAVIRALPLPFVARGIGATVLYPDDPEIMTLFGRLGRAITVQNEADIDVLLAGSATMANCYHGFGVVERKRQGDAVFWVIAL